jgi:hypothetical protein
LKSDWIIDEFDGKITALSVVVLVGVAWKWLGELIDGGP